LIAQCLEESWEGIEGGGGRGWRRRKRKMKIRQEEGIRGKRVNGRKGRQQRSGSG
jgi:hypothetical protein